MMRKQMNMAMKYSAIAIMLTSLVACATQQDTPIVFTQAKSVDTRPALIQLPSSNPNFQLLYGQDRSLERAFNAYAKTGKAPNIMTNGFYKYAYSPESAPIIKVAPLILTVFELEPGEQYTDVSVGDPARWTLSASVSGSGAKKQQNIMVKPSAPDLSTVLVISTNKRLYTIKLMSTNDASNAAHLISFWYPDEMLKAINSATTEQAEDGGTVAKVPNLNINNLNFNYDVSGGGIFGSGPSWRPTRVFDDGQHTYIQFPESMSYRDMPALFVLNGQDKELVNYRSKPPYFVVDKLFKQAVLVLGIGQNQSRVVITNNQLSA